MLTYFKVSNRIQELRKDIRGATAIEYALIAAAIALVIIVSLALLVMTLKLYLQKYQLVYSNKLVFKPNTLAKAVILPNTE